MYKVTNDIIKNLAYYYFCGYRRKNVLSNREKQYSLTGNYVIPQATKLGQMQKCKNFKINVNVSSKISF